MTEREELARLRKLVVFLIEGIQTVLEMTDPERSTLEHEIHYHCLGTLTDEDGQPLPPKFASATK